MMKFKSIAAPEPSKGVTIKGPKLVQPNQSLSLQEILDRFTRGEPLAIGQPVEYHESDDDLEKIAHADMVDKQEFIDKQKDTQKRFEREERKRKKDEHDRVVREAAEQLKASGGSPDVAK